MLSPSFPKAYQRPSYQEKKALASKVFSSGIIGCTCITCVQPHRRAIFVSRDKAIIATQILELERLCCDWSQGIQADCTILTDFAVFPSALPMEFWSRPTKCHAPLRNLYRPSLKPSWHLDRIMTFPSSLTPVSGQTSRSRDFS